ncbi:ABC transporter permease [Cohnella endophytica]|uniref:ABC transporter permease n=1 Tax=Cohnella endophytica TaxID=2419778 RepID=UPI001314C3DD|nr:ABC transporter permease [Cohnella endophytica]
MVDRPREEQTGFLRTLRQSRAAAFRNEIFPHFRYVFQSGFGLFVSAIFFSALVWYVDLIKNVPAEWLSGIVGIALMWMISIRAPLRTYLQPADPIFLLAMEGQVRRSYIDPALRKAIVTAVLRAVAVFCLYAPIYARAPKTADIAGTHPALVVGALLAIVAGCNVYGGWRERKPAFSSWRLGLRLVRWLLSAIAIAAILLKPLLLAVPLLILCMAVMTLLWRLPAQHALPWDRLIEEEAGSRRRWMSFLGWFVDVPSEQSKPARRRWIAWAADLLPWQHGRSWHYLYAKVFLRGETFGAFWRWLLLAGIIMIVSGNALADAIIYGIAILIIGLQLSELRRVSFVETAATLPIAPEGRLVAAAAIARASGIAAALFLGLVGIVTAGVGASGGAGTSDTGAASVIHLDIWVPLIAAGLLWCGWWMPRKIAKFADEDDL